jgi:hypothetical protein
MMYVSWLHMMDHIDEVPHWMDGYIDHQMHMHPEMMILMMMLSPP